LFRLNVLPPSSTSENLPTAYMVPPHRTSWRTCSTVEVLAGKCGVPVAGRAWTKPDSCARWPPTAARVDAAGTSSDSTAAAAAAPATARADRDLQTRQTILFMVAFLTDPRQEVLR